MTSDPWFSPATSALLLAMTALQCVDGVPAGVALQRARDEWRRHIDERGNDTWEFPQLQALVERLTG